MASDCPAEQLVEIRSLAQGGHGVATSADGRTLFVPGTVPGDRLRCRITEVRRRYLRGQLVELMQSGPER
ncbi:MAG: TRAM domain-containing protein, partial [Desulfuromonas thiophila]|nr:TRAM domain-containing protein [Desulfuromonas thiophila]